jgi:hypothetical protein
MIKVSHKKLEKPNKPKKPKKSTPTDSRIIAALRSVWLRSSERAAALKRAKVIGKGNGYQCERCGCIVHKTNELNVHHKIPVGSLDDWGAWISRLFCGVDGYQVVCKLCHVIIHKGDGAIIDTNVIKAFTDSGVGYDGKI